MHGFVALAVIVGSAGTIATGAAARVYVATITADQEVPPSASTATGTGVFQLDDTGLLTYSITFGGLHGAETGAAVHGPAVPGSIGPVVFTLPLGTTVNGVLGPLAAAQIGQLDAGLWYVSIHSSHHAGGEVRGQILQSTTAVEAGGWAHVKALYRAH